MSPRQIVVANHILDMIERRSLKKARSVGHNDTVTTVEPITLRVPEGFHFSTEEGDRGLAVYLPTYRIGRYRVTNPEYEQFLLYHPGQGLPSNWTERWVKENVPKTKLNNAVKVSLDGAKAYSLLGLPILSTSADPIMDFGCEEQGHDDEKGVS